jgi:GntR family transcriptional regulator/MocR family aminotransferase
MEMMIFKANPISLALDIPLYQQLYIHLRMAILAGDLQPGMRLPSTRALADELSISRNTVLNAYQQLLAEGYVNSTVGNGTFVAQVLPEHLLTSPEPRQFVDTQPAEPRKPRLSTAAIDPGGASPRPFRFGVPALQAFPYKLWTRLVVRRARNMTAGAFTYQNLSGYAPLREAIAAHVTVSRRVQCSPEQIIILPGAQGGLDLAARMLIHSGDPVWMEDPGYLPARGAFLGSGAQIVPVPVDTEGLVVNEGIARAPQARLVYVTPSHQFPLGVTMSLKRRLALLDWAKHAEAYILEDDYDSEYHFVRRPLPALQGLAERDTGRVIYVGTFSKMLFPALGIGYLILPPALVRAFEAVRSFINVHPPILEQMVLTDFIVEGHFIRHLRRMRSLYAERRAALLEAARAIPLDIHPPEAGLHCVGWLPEGIDELVLVRAATAQGVDLVPVSNFSIEPLRRKGVILGYAEYNAEQIQDGMRRLAVALHSI